MSGPIIGTVSALPTVVGALVAARCTLSQMARTPDWIRATALAVQAEHELAAAEGAATESSRLIVPVGALRRHMLAALDSMRRRRGREAQVLKDLTRVQAELEHVIALARAGAGEVT